MSVKQHVTYVVYIRFDYYNYIDQIWNKQIGIRRYVPIVY